MDFLSRYLLKRNGVDPTKGVKIVPGGPSAGRLAGMKAGLVDGAFRALMRFQVDRARGYYRSAEQLSPRLEAPGRAVFQVMLRTYRGLIDEIERRDYDVFRGRVSLSPWRKLALVARALPVRWGWA